MSAGEGSAAPRRGLEQALEAGTSQVSEQQITVSRISRETSKNPAADRVMGSAADDVVTLARADVRALLGLLLWVHDSILRQPDNDALIRRVGAAIGRPL